MPYEPDGTFSPEDEEFWAAMTHSMPTSLPVSEAQHQRWLDGIDKKAQAGWLTWADVVTLSVAAAVNIAIILFPLLTAATGVLVALVGLVYGIMLRAITRAVPSESAV